MKLIIDISEEDYKEVREYGINMFPTVAQAIQNGMPLDDVITKLEEHKYSREYCIEHDIDWAINMEMVRIILNNIGKEDG